MPRPALTIALLSSVAAFPSSAQHGGHAGHPGRSSGITGHSVPAFTSHSAFVGGVHLPNNGGLRLSQRSTSAPAFRGSYGFPDERRYRPSFRRAYPVAIPYAVSGWIAPGYLDSGFYDNEPGAAPPANYEGDAQNAVPSLRSGQGVESSEAPAPPVFRPAYVRPQPAPVPVPDHVVTLIFKDGRPDEQIHNYLLTRTTLYVEEQHLRQIPVDELDLEATAKMNLDAGVDFRLPSAVR